MEVSEDDAYNFAYVLPPEHPDDDVELVIPLALQIGWCDSPVYFCSATETARDVADKLFRENTPVPFHPQEEIIMNIDWKSLPKEIREDEDNCLVHCLEVYIDDFIGMIQATDEPTLKRFTQCVLEGITSVFPDPKLTGSKMGPPISPSKLEEEGPWSTRKEILGWLMDGLARTI